MAEQIFIPQPVLAVSLHITFIRREGFSVHSCSDLNYVLDFINRVFYPAGISFFLRGCRFFPYMKDSDPKGERNEKGFHRASLMDLTSDVNVFVVPYIEENDGTLAYTRFLGVERYIVIGEVASNNDGTYTRFQQGRFSNMFAHELGHILDLDHVGERGFLMYPSQLKDADPISGSEEALSASEIQTMRSYLMNKNKS